MIQKKKISILNRLNLFSKATGKSSAPTLIVILILAALIFEGLPATAQNLPGAYFLGKSVNLLKGETSPGSRTLLQTLTDEEIDYLPGGPYKAKTHIATDISDATSQYSAKMGIEGSYGAFSARAELNFSKEIRQRTKTKIVMIVKDLPTARLSIKSRNYYLDGEFESALNDPYKSPETLFEEYGTHVTIGVKVGGRVTGVFTSQENTREANESLQASAEAKYGTVTVSAEYSQSQSSYNQSIRMNENWIIRGGDPAAKNMLEVNRTTEDYNTWAASTERNPGFFAFEELKPIWKLVTDGNRSKELEEAFQRLFTKRSLENPQMFVLKSERANKISTQTLEVPQGYKILSGGAQVNWTSYGNILTASYPQNLRNWVVRHKDHHVSESSFVTVYAMAVYDPFEKLEVRIVEQSSPREIKVIEQASLGFDVNSDFALVGGGAEAVYDGSGSLLTASFPHIAEGSGYSYWVGRSMDHMVSDPSYLTSYAIFVRFKDGSYQVRTKHFGFSTGVGGVNSLDAGVDYGYHFVGGGAYTITSSGGVTQNFLTASYPQDNRWFAASKDHHVSRHAILHVFAIGLQIY